MSNFFTDNVDLQHRFNSLSMRQAIELLEGDLVDAGPGEDDLQSYTDALDNYRSALELCGKISSESISLTANSVDESGTTFSNGLVEYATGTIAGKQILADCGFFGIIVPQQYGGLNFPATIYTMMIEIVSRADASLMTLFGYQDIGEAVARLAPRSLSEELLPKYCRGELTGAMVLTESGGGSDLQAIKTRATLDSDGSWRISGSKQYISHGNGELLLVLAKSEDASSGMFGLSLFAVEGGNDNGVDVKGVERKMGLHGSPTCELQFNHSKAVLLGDRKFGLFHVVEILNQARFSVAAQGIGIATAAYYSAKDYANIRRAFNSYLHEIPAVSQLLKNMEVKLAASRALLYSGTQWIDLRNTLEHKLSKQKANKEKIDKVDQITLKEAQAMVNLLSPVAKYLSTEWANQICYDAQQIHGGSGYIKGTTVERCIRDVRITTIYEGTTQVLVGLAFKYVLNDVLKRQIDDFRNQSFPKPLGECQSALINAYANFKEACDIVNSESQNFKLAAAKDVTDLYGCIYAGILLITSAEPDNEENTICRIHCLETKALSLASLSRVQSKIWSTPSLHC